MSGVSAFKNAIQRREHRERPQPSYRAKFGLLEKHKDYVLRARAFHKKEDQMKRLKRKAAMRNEDEFNFGMVKAKTKEGVHVLPTAGGEISGDMLKVLKSQDAKYVNMKAQTDKKKIEKLQSNLHFIGAAPTGKHTVFVKSEEDAKKFKPEKYFDTVPELADRSYNRLKKSQLETADLSLPDSKKRRKIEKSRDAAYQELVERLDRSGKLSAASRHLELQKALMGKGPRRKIKEADGDKPPVFKWKAVRKK